MLSIVTALFCFALSGISSGASLFSRQAATIPGYVTRFGRYCSPDSANHQTDLIAPLVYIDVNDPFLPSDIGAQITNTSPELNFTRIASGPQDLTLSNLASLNEAGGCTIDKFDACDVYLTSRENVPSRPKWLYGVLPDPVTGETTGAVSSAIIVNDHNNSGIVDAFYFYFYAFNLGQNLSGTILGNHVGDWEHSMVRFMGGEPQTIWYSAHDAGFVYTYDAVEKNGSRPIVYSSLGGHANYPTPGLQSRSIGAIKLNDTTSKGPLWDPVKSAYFYTFMPTSTRNGTFVAGSGTGAAADSAAPIDWLYFLGRWGDKQYPDSNPAQINIANLTFAYEDGPTGPLDKDLDRLGTCPDSKQPCQTTSKLPVPSGTLTPIATIRRVYSSAAGTSSATASGTAGGAQSSGASGSASGSTGSPNGVSQGREGWLLVLPVGMLCTLLVCMY